MRTNPDPLQFLTVRKVYTLFLHPQIPFLILFFKACSPQASSLTYWKQPRSGKSFNQENQGSDTYCKKCRACTGLAGVRQKCDIYVIFFEL